MLMIDWWSDLSDRNSPLRYKFRQLNREICQYSHEIVRVARVAQYHGGI